VERLTRLARPASSAEARLSELVSAAGPIATFEAHKRQTLAAILTDRAERHGGLLALRLALGAGILLAAGAATAAFGVRHWRAEAPPPAVAVAATPVVHHTAPRPIALAQPVAAPELAAPAPEVPVLRARPHRAEDPARVVAALQALRQDHDPSRAGRLLAAYLRAYPRGALAEEATALSIEAADARHSPAAMVFAERYLRDYPSGRFHQTAQRVLARAKP
jgi:hypothetical protein